jgi:flagellar basal-body rod modification protein FlgD
MLTGTLPASATAPGTAPGAAPGASPGTQAGRDQATLNDDLNKFLILLVTQLKNQDPLEPLKAQEFTAQLVQFASVEQQIKQNGNLENLLAAQRSAEAASAVSYLGRTVEIAGNGLILGEGGAEAVYALAEPTHETKLTITDARGRVVFSAEGAESAGSHAFAWDGIGEDGQPLPPGLYTLGIDARRKDGSAIEAQTATLGRVDSTSFAQGETTLHVGGVDVPLHAVLAVHAAPARAAAAAGAQ